ncbi:MAG: nuclear transport factor 2 family protein [Chloroflexi bacterium]|nr:nuclear transport factor 2 family protein [Chloroflexota bacterium]
MSQKQDVEEQIIQLENQRFQAMTSADTDALKLILADELTYTHTSAAQDTKQSLIEALQSGTLKYESIDTDDVNVRVYGDTAVVTGSAKLRVVSRGQNNSFALRFTDVYAKQDDRWQMVAWQSTRIPEA